MSERRKSGPVWLWPILGVVVPATGLIAFDWDAPSIIALLLIELLVVQIGLCVIVARSAPGMPVFVTVVFGSVNVFSLAAIGYVCGLFVSDSTVPYDWLIRALFDRPFESLNVPFCLGLLASCVQIAIRLARGELYPQAASTTADHLDTPSQRMRRAAPAVGALLGFGLAMPVLLFAVTAAGTAMLPAGVFAAVLVAARCLGDLLLQYVAWEHSKAIDAGLRQRAPDAAASESLAARG